MDLDTTSDIVAITVGAITIVGAVFGAWWKWERPRRRRAEQRGETLNAIATVILGRAEVLDQSGEVALPAQPGVPARIDRLDTRLDRVDTRLDEVGAEVRSMKDDVHDRISHVERGLIAFGQRLNGVEDLVRGCPAHAPTSPAVSASLSVTTNPATEEPS